MGLVLNKNISGIRVNLSDRSSVFIMPGINEIKDEQFSLFKSHPLVKGRIERGIIEILPELKLGEDGKKPIRELLNQISKISDIKLLKRIMKEDGREDIVDACKDKIDSIVPKKTDKKTENESHFS